MLVNTINYQRKNMNKYENVLNIYDYRRKIRQKSSE